MPRPVRLLAHAFTGGLGSESSCSPIANTAVTILSSLVPSPSPHVGERRVWCSERCHNSPIRELESDCRTSSSTRFSMAAVRCTCTGNAIITFFTPFDPAPCDKKCRSEHQTLFPLFGGGVWGRDYILRFLLGAG